MVLTLTATDSIGVTAYFASETNTTPLSGDGGWTSVTAAASYAGTPGFTLSSGAATKTVYVWFKDGSGNVSVSASDTIIKDGFPTSPSLSINSAAPTTISTTVTLNLSATDGGITGYYVSESPATPASGAGGWVAVTSATNFTAAPSFTFATGSAETKTVYGWFKDQVGHVSAVSSDTINHTVASGALDTSFSGDGIFTLSALTGGTYTFGTDLAPDLY